MTQSKRSRKQVDLIRAAVRQQIQATQKASTLPAKQIGKPTGKGKGIGKLFTNNKNPRR